VSVYFVRLKEFLIVPSLDTLNPSQYCTVVWVNVGWGHFPSATADTFVFGKRRNLFTLCKEFICPLFQWVLLLQNFTLTQLVKKFFALYGNPSGLILDSRKPADHSPSRATWLHFASSQSIKRRWIFFLPHNQYLNSRLLTKIFPFISSNLNVRATVTASSILLHLITLLTLHSSADCGGTFFIPVCNFLLRLVTPFLWGRIFLSLPCDTDHWKVYNVP